MLVHVETVHLYCIFVCNILFQGKARSHLFRKYLRVNQIFQQNHFNLLIRDPGGFDSGKKNFQKSRGTATLSYWFSGSYPAHLQKHSESLHKNQVCHDWCRCKPYLPFFAICKQKVGMWKNVNKSQTYVHHDTVHVYIVQVIEDGLI